MTSNATDIPASAHVPGFTSRARPASASRTIVWPKPKPKRDETPIERTDVFDVCPDAPLHVASGRDRFDGPGTALFRGSTEVSLAGDASRLLAAIGERRRFVAEEALAWSLGNDVAGLLEELVRLGLLSRQMRSR